VCVFFSCMRFFACYRQHGNGVHPSRTLNSILRQHHGVNCHDAGHFQKFTWVLVQHSDHQFT
jgi:hypothetical protein